MRHAFLVLLLLSFGSGNGLFAGLIVKLEPTGAFQTLSTQSVRIWVENAGVDAVSISAMNLDFHLIPETSTDGSAVFTAIQPSAVSIMETDPDYLFHNNSAKVLFSLPPIFPISPLGTVNSLPDGTTTFTGGDGSGLGSATLQASESKLIAELQIQQLTATIDLPNTYLIDVSGTSFVGVGDLQLDDSQVGDIQFTGSAAPPIVPEPSSFAIFMMGCLGATSMRRRKRIC